MKFIVLLVAGLFFGSLLPAVAEIRVGTVDISKIRAEYWRSQEAEREIKKIEDAEKQELEKYVGRCKRLEGEIRDLITREVHHPSNSLDEQAERLRQLELKKKELQEAEEELKAFTAPKDVTLPSRKVRLRRGIREDILKVVETLAKERNYDFVFDSSAKGITRPFAEVLLHAKPGSDLTQGVLDVLNKDRPQEGAKETPVSAKPTKAAKSEE